MNINNLFWSIIMEKNKLFKNNEIVKMYIVDKKSVSEISRKLSIPITLVENILEINNVFVDEISNDKIDIFNISIPFLLGCVIFYPLLSAYLIGNFIYMGLVGFVCSGLSLWFSFKFMRNFKIGKVKAMNYLLIYGYIYFCMILLFLIGYMLDIKVISAVTPISFQIVIMGYFTTKIDKEPYKKYFGY